MAGTDQHWLSMRNIRVGLGIVGEGGFFE